MVASQPRSFEEPRTEPRGVAAFLRVDPLLLLAAVALIAASILTLAETSTNDRPGDPNFFIIRQSIYAVLGLALMLALDRKSVV